MNLAGGFGCVPSRTLVKPRESLSQVALKNNSSEQEKCQYWGNIDTAKVLVNGVIPHQRKNKWHQELFFR